jgi:anti-sigma regulatory factor (Ser/Thr protein kinase)
MPAQLRYKNTFPCNPSAARLARKALVAFARAWLKGADSTDFESAVGEALANAIEHGKCSIVTVECWYDRQKLVAEIRQNGFGFEPPTAHAPQQGSSRGYGLFIMRTVMDHVEFLENGTRVRLIKRAS